MVLDKFSQPAFDRPMRSIILFLFAVGVLLLAHWAMPRIVGGLRRMSRLPENRLTEDEAVPVWFVGNFERAMAVVLVLANVRGAYALLAAWLGAKLATSWQRLPIDNTDLETSRQVRGRNAGCAHGGDNLRYIRDRRRPTFPLRVSRWLMLLVRFSRTVPGGKTGTLSAHISARRGALRCEGRSGLHTKAEARGCNFSELCCNLAR
jgi:hypothetical protein